MPATPVNDNLTANLSDPAAPVADHICRVVSQRNCGPNLWIITFESLKSDSPKSKTTAASFDCKSGQFVMIDLPDSRFFFRRPFSVLKVIRTTSSTTQFEILYKVVGQGTQMMADFQPGHVVNILGPLGQPFPAVNDFQTSGIQNILLLGGGIGIAPLASWLEEHPDLRPKAICAFGTRNASELSIKKELEQYLPAQQRMFTTNDGSYTGTDGFNGRIDQWLLSAPEKVQEACVAFICGPMPMMKACSAVLKELKPALPVFVSLENHMPCGTGVCSGCVVFSADSLPIKVCLEGPVLNANRINWANADGRQSGVKACTNSSLANTVQPDHYTSPVDTKLDGLDDKSSEHSNLVEASQCHQ